MPWAWITRRSIYSVSVSRREYRAYRVAGAGVRILYAAQVARGYSVMANGGFPVTPFFISKIETDQGGVIFEERPKVACPQCNLPVIYGDTPKSDVLENKDVEDVATSATPQNSARRRSQSLNRSTRRW